MKKRSPCPIATALDIVGDKWTLLIIRDLMLGKRRFSEFADSMEAIPTNLLSERLQRLLTEGLVERRQYSAHLKRYEYFLTEKGEELLPALRELANWSHKHLRDTVHPPHPFANDN